MTQILSGPHSGANGARRQGAVFRDRRRSPLNTACDLSSSLREYSACGGVRLQRSRVQGAVQDSLSLLILHLRRRGNDFGVWAVCMSTEFDIAMSYFEVNPILHRFLAGRYGVQNRNPICFDVSMGLFDVDLRIQFF